MNPEQRLERLESQMRELRGIQSLTAGAGAIRIGQNAVVEGDLSVSGNLVAPAGSVGYAANAGLIDGVDSAMIVYGTHGFKSTGLDTFNDFYLPSGFYNGYNVPGAPSPNAWYHLLNQQHQGGNYQMQIAQSYVGDEWHVRRSTAGVWGSWRMLLHDGNMPYLEIYQSTARVMPSGPWTTWNFNTTHRVNGVFNASGGGYTVPNSGMYAYSMSVAASSWSGNYSMGFQIGGTWKQVFGLTFNSGQNWGSVTGIAWADAGQAIVPLFQQNTGADKTLDAAAQYGNWLRIARIA